MESKMLKILTEIGISILMLVIVSIVVIVVLYNKVPYGKIIPESIEYQNIDPQEYSVRGGVEELKKATETFESNLNDLYHYETEGRVILGTMNPFGSIQSNSDLPTEVIGKTDNSSDPGENEQNEQNGQDWQNELPGHDSVNVNQDINPGAEERMLESEI